MREQSSNFSFKQSLAPVSISADTDGATISLQDGQSALIIASIGLATGVDGSNFFELEVEESVNGTDWTDVANADLSTYVTGTNVGTFAKIDHVDEDNMIYTTDYIGGKPYIRIVSNETGTVTSFVLDLIVGKGNLGLAPKSNN